MRVQQVFWNDEPAALVYGVTSEIRALALASIELAVMPSQLEVGSLERYLMQGDDLTELDRGAHPEGSFFARIVQ